MKHMPIDNNILCEEPYFILKYNNCNFYIDGKATYIYFLYIAHKLPIA